MVVKHGDESYGIQSVKNHRIKTNPRMTLWGPYKQGYFNPVKLLVGFWMILKFLSRRNQPKKTPETNFDHFGGYFPMVRWSLCTYHIPFKN